MGLDISYFAAFVAGLISFVSPCVLPIVPPYLCFIAGMSMDELAKSRENNAAYKKVIAASVAFVMGFATVFVALGASASFIGGFVTRHLDTLSMVAGVIIIILGLHFLGVFKIGLLYREARVHVERKPAGLIGSYVVGLAFAFGWTPCVGPVLAAVLFAAGAEGSALHGALLLLAYALGIGIPFILASFFVVPFMGWMRRFSKHLGKVEKVMGGMLVLTGILFITGQMNTLSYLLLDWFPSLGRIG
ncbi:MAG: sulfite exporter TauE/SafE family protein [Rhizobiaceae bacterium]|nr:sulfite exporter TauE/SafE family protein [Rhizobiaceae bacterium]